MRFARLADCIVWSVLSCTPVHALPHRSFLLHCIQVGCANDRIVLPSNAQYHRTQLDEQDGTKSRALDQPCRNSRHGQYWGLTSQADRHQPHCTVARRAPQVQRNDQHLSLKLNLFSSTDTSLHRNSIRCLFRLTPRFFFSNEPQL